MMKKILFLTIFAFSVIEGTFAQSTTRSLSRLLADADLPYNPILKPFYHGVASGDPLADRVIIWTRVSPESPQDQGSVQVKWTVATDVKLLNVVSSGVIVTDSTKDYTVHVDVTGLNGATYYYYGFEALGASSITGRTKTSPAANQGVDRMRFGVVSCVNYPRGYLNAFGAMAASNDLDAIIHLGDYIYEYEEGGYGFNENVDRPIAPDQEIVSLTDYRIRYSLYRLDPDLMRAHQLYPFVAVWDDHETADNAYKDGANNHTEGAEGSWVDRKAAGVQAFGEWLPIRVENSNQPEIIHRKFTYGTLMDLIMLDTRLEGRDKQAAMAAATVGPTEEYFDSTRTLLGANQYNWFTQALKQSTAQWKVIGNQVMVSPLRAANSMPVNLDQWDGYPGEQTNLFNFLNTNEIKDVVVLTGDIHSSWGIDIAQNPLVATQYNPLTGAGSLGVEFVCPGVSSPPFGSSFEATSTGLEPEALIQVIKSNNPHMKYIDVSNNGYLVLDVSPQKTQSDWFFTGVEQRSDKAEFGAGWYTNAGESHLQAASGPMAIRTDVPVAPQAPLATSIATISNEPVLLGAYPNPFTDEITIHYALPAHQNVIIEMLNVLGEEVMTLKEESQAAGIYQLAASTTALPKGVYFLTIRTANATKVVRMVK